MNHPNFSVIVPVFHEGERISELIEHLKRLDSGEDIEIIIIDGAPEKDTLKAVQDLEVIKVASEKGRARQMNMGASVAQGTILIFLHADTELPNDAFKLIHTLMGRKECVGGAFDLGIKSNRPIFKVIGVMASFRSRLNQIPYGDQAIFIQRKYFNEIGGYKEIPLMEDVELMRRIKKSGGKIWIFPERVMTSPRRWEREGTVYCTLRNLTLQMLYFLGVSPEKLSNYYKEISDKARNL